MTNSYNVTLGDGLPRKTAGRLSMISLLAISVGIAAAPANAQDMIAPADMPMQSPVAAPQPAPAPAPIAQSPASTTAQASTVPPLSPDRANALATKGGFDATNVAPEALAQIESEQQARKAAAAKSAAATTAASASAVAPARSSNLAANSAADSRGVSSNVSDSTNEVVPPVAGLDNATPALQPAPATSDSAATSTDMPADPDWTLLGALAALIGIGGVGAYTAARRRKSNRKSQDRQVAAPYPSDPVPASVTEAIMPELRRDTVDAEVLPPAEEVTPIEASPLERSLSAKSDFTQFVADLPAFEAPRSKADRSVTNGDRRIGAAPKPYVTEADLYRPDGYFTANVNSMPTAQNPFLTRHNRLIRAQYLDGKMAEMKMQASIAAKPTRVTGTMQASRPVEPAFS